MLLHRSSPYRFLAILLFTSMTAATASENDVNVPGPERAVEAGVEACSEATRLEATQLYNNAVLMEKTNHLELAVHYFQEAMDRLDDPNDPIYKKADLKLHAIRLQAFVEIPPAVSRPKAFEAYQAGVVMEKTNHPELAAYYFQEAMDRLDDPNDPIYKKADQRLKRLAGS